MKLNKIILMAAVACFFLLPAMTLATTYTFTSNDGSGTQNDLSDLDHNYLYLWGINSGIDANQTILSATITFTGIRNSEEPEANDILRVFLLDNPFINDNVNQVDIIQIYDGQSQIAPNQIPAYLGTNFTAITDLMSWTDPNVAIGDVDPATGAVRSQWGTYTFDYNFTADQLAMLSDYLLSPVANGFNSTFGLGFDPDCHYTNGGITLTVNTAPVPEPGTIFLLGTGFLGLVVFGRRRIRS